MNYEDLKVTDLRVQLRDKVNAGAVRIGNNLPTAMTAGKWIALADRQALLRALATCAIDGEPYDGYNDRRTDITPPTTSHHRSEMEGGEQHDTGGNTGEGEGGEQCKDDGKGQGEGGQDESTRPGSDEQTTDDVDRAVKEITDRIKDDVELQSDVAVEQGIPNAGGNMAEWWEQQAAHSKVAVTRETLLDVGEKIVRVSAEIALDAIERAIEAHHGTTGHGIDTDATSDEPTVPWTPQAPVYVIKTPTGDRREQGTELEHYLLPLITTILSTRVPLMLTGGAGAGKTHAVEQAARILFGDRDHFHPKSCGPEMAEYDLHGYRDATGAYRKGITRHPFEHGGVLALDEMDRSSAALSSLNSMLANRYCSFPDGVVASHEDFIAVAMTNTGGGGADLMYTSAVRIDAASLDRFAVLPFEIDERLEAALIGATADGWKPAVKYSIRKRTVNAQAWRDRVISVRRAVEQCRARMIVSPRAVINGHKLLCAGIDQPTVELLTIWKATEPATIDKVKSVLKQRGQELTSIEAGQGGK